MNDEPIIKVTPTNHYFNGKTGTAQTNGRQDDSSGFLGPKNVGLLGEVRCWWRVRDVNTVTAVSSFWLSSMKISPAMSTVLRTQKTGTATGSTSEPIPWPLISEFGAGHEIVYRI